MCRAQCVLAVVALYVGVVLSWDYAVSSGDQLIFYVNNGIETNRVQFTSQNIGGLAYDAVHNRMLYVDKQNNNDSICGYNLSSKENKCFFGNVTTASGRNILSIAYDPPTEKLFFTDTNEKSINWISLKPRSKNNITGNLLIKMDDRTPNDIAVDSCGGCIYWSNQRNDENCDIERARLDGSGRECLYDKDDNYPVNSLTIDPQTQRMYFCEVFGYNFFRSADMKRQRDDLLTYFYDKHEVSEMTVSKDYVYFVNTTGSYKTVVRLAKNNLKELSKFYTDKSLGVAANYKIQDQIMGIKDCDSLSNLIPTITEAPGCTCERCDVCVNYCLHGNCSVSDEGLPKCSCNAGYSGERCEVSACHGYCLNDGECYLNEEDDPVCQCAGNHEGARCEANVTDSTATYELSNRNLTLADLQTICQKPSSRILILVEIP